MGALYDSLCYRYPVAKLTAGGSYGNPDCFARTDAQSGLDGLWLAATNEWLCGVVAPSWRTLAGRVAEGATLLPTETEFWPGHQATTFVGPGVTARLRVFVPYGAPPGQCAQVYFGVEVTAEAPVTVELAWDIRWPAFLSPIHSKQPERAQWQKRLQQWQEGPLACATTRPIRYARYDTTVGDPQEARVFGAALDPVARETSEPGRLRLTYHLAAAPGAPIRQGWLLAAGAGGFSAVRAAYAAAPAWADALAATQAALEAELGTAHLRVPNPVISRGLQWAKMNTLRVQHQYRYGVAFTNDPPQDIVVVRDCAWYGLGADWLSPGFVRAMFDLLLAHGREPGGGMTEYIHADSGAREDYALNVNDDTPLFVVAAQHHYAVTGDAAFLDQVYPAVRAACDWLLSQRRDGLVWCQGEGTDVWGNATWRNIIPGYRLAGAVTEINSLTVWALGCAAALAGSAGAPDDAARWREAEAALRAAIAGQLRNEPAHAYLLNRDEDGAHTDLTADLVFPVLAGVAEGAEAAALLDRLYSADFYTPFGIHTVGKAEAAYHPSYGYGLLGGLWPNLTAWVAFAGRHAYPARLAEMMDHLYALCEPADPRAGGRLVPSEFPEWFHGETYQSLGMAMSPWMPPTYLWLGIEGLAGVRPTPAGLEVAPNLPPEWTWMALRALPYRGGRVSFFAHAGRLYSTAPLISPWPVEVFATDASDEVTVEGPFTALALGGPGGGAVLVMASAAGQGAVRWGAARQAVALAAGEAVVLRFAPPESAPGA
jgi:hypothetical protein